jgi:hypothetical protein
MRFDFLSHPHSSIHTSRQGAMKHTQDPSDSLRITHLAGEKMAFNGNRARAPTKHAGSRFSLSETRTLCK